MTNKSRSEVAKQMLDQYFSELQGRQKQQLLLLESCRQRLSNMHDAELDEFRDLSRDIVDHLEYKDAETEAK